MTDDRNWQEIADEELRFFGDISASLSHEINNRFAVISEKAGLIEDLAIMSARGKKVDPGRFEDQGRKISNQVRMAKQIVRKLNRFAHSADVPVAEIDIGDVLGFVAELCSRKADMAQVALDVSKPARPILMTAPPFIVENLVGRCIDLALSKCDEQKTVTIETKSTAEGITIRFGQLAGFSGPDSNPGLSALLECLGASVQSNADGTALILDLPNQSASIKGSTS